MMIFINAAEKDGLTKVSYESFLKILAPFAPHLTEELWHELGHSASIHLEAFPVADRTLAEDSTVSLAVQINGKMRGTVVVAKGAVQETVLTQIKEEATFAKHLRGEIRKVIYVPGKIINIIVA
jgi:leucyl-tRNA synthetase